MSDKVPKPVIHESRARISETREVPCHTCELCERTYHVGGISRKVYESEEEEEQGLSIYFGDLGMSKMYCPFCGKKQGEDQ